MAYYEENKHWRWLFKNAIDWDRIVPLYEANFPNEDGIASKEEYVNFLEELLLSTGEWVDSVGWERAEQLDRIGAGEVKDGKTYPSEPLKALYKDALEMGIFSLNAPKEFGGMDLPGCMLLIMFSQLSRPCLSSSTQLGFFNTILEMVNKYCDEEDRQNYIPRIMAGELSGSMNLTEPGCGSDLGMIRTMATKQDDGTYLLNGSKCFITNGGGGIGFVLAKIKGAPDDLSGISMFICDQNINGEDGELNFKVTKNEEKMGLHGSFTTEVVYENSKAKLIGKENEGFKYMLHLMNEARIAVGMQALGGIEACINYARQYATERVQFGKPIADLPLMKRNLEEFETERDAYRALMIDSCSWYDMYNRLSTKKYMTPDEFTKDDEKLFKEVSMWTRKRTPLVKYYGAEAFTHLSKRAIQVLGGYGFMQEYPVERIHRDSFAPLLYEGTSQIQALMAMKDTVKYILKDPKSFFSSILLKHPLSDLLSGKDEWTREFTSMNYNFKKKMMGLLVKTLKPKSGSILDLKNWSGQENVENLMIHAETLCQATAYMETMRVLASHANKDNSQGELLFKYADLIKPRMEAIYTDWSIRA